MTHVSPASFDWSASAHTTAASAHTTKKPASAKQKQLDPLADAATAPVTVPTEKQKQLDPLADAATAPVPEAETAESAAEEEDEEAKKRRARAARFGIAVVEPKQKSALKKELKAKGGRAGGEGKKNPQTQQAAGKTNGAAKGEKKNATVKEKVEEVR